MDTLELVKRFIVEEFIPDLTPADLDTDYDLAAGGVIDSLGLLKVIAWLEDGFGVDAGGIEFYPEQFRTAGAIADLVEATAVKAG